LYVELFELLIANFSGPEVLLQDLRRDEIRGFTLLYFNEQPFCVLTTSSTREERGVPARDQCYAGTGHQDTILAHFGSR